MFELVKIFFQQEAKSIWNKIVVLLILGVLFLIVDTFTTYPSLSFTHDKYATLQIMSGLLKDSTVSPEQKVEIKKEFAVLASRKSFRDASHSLGERNITLMHNISHIPSPVLRESTTRVPRTFPGPISWLIYLFASTGLFILGFVFAGIMFFRRKKNRTQDNWIAIALSILFLLVLVGIAYLIVLILNPFRHIVSTAISAQAIVILVLAAIGKIMEFRAGWKKRQAAGVTDNSVPAAEKGL